MQAAADGAKRNGVLVRCKASKKAKIKGWHWKTSCWFDEEGLAGAGAAGQHWQAGVWRLEAWLVLAKPDGAWARLARPGGVECRRVQMRGHQGSVSKLVAQMLSWMAAGVTGVKVSKCRGQQIRYGYNDGRDGGQRGGDGGQQQQQPASAGNKQGRLCQRSGGPAIRRVGVDGGVGAYECGYGGRLCGQYGGCRGECSTMRRSI